MVHVPWRGHWIVSLSYNYCRFRASDNRSIISNNYNIESPSALLPALPHPTSSVSAIWKVRQRDLSTASHVHVLLSPTLCTDSRVSVKDVLDVRFAFSTRYYNNIKMNRRLVL